MASNGAPQPLAFRQIWPNVPGMAAAKDRMRVLSEHLSRLRFGNGGEFADDAGYTAETAKSIKVMTGELVVLQDRAEQDLARYRELSQAVEALGSSKRLLDEMANDGSQQQMGHALADADALLAWLIQNKRAFIGIMRGFGEELPPKMATALESMNLDVQDSQPLRDAHARVEELLPLRNANSALETEVADLRRRVESRVRKLEDSRRALERANQEREVLRTRLKRREDTIDSHIERNGLQERELTKLKALASESEKERDSLKKNGERVEAERDVLRRDLDASKKDVEDSRQSLVATNNALETSRRKYTTIRGAMERVNTSHAQLLATIQSQRRQLQAVREAEQAWLQERTSLRGMVTDTREENNRLVTNLDRSADVERKCLALESNVRRLEECLEKAKKEAQAASEAREEGARRLQKSLQKTLTDERAASEVKERELSDAKKSILDARREMGGLRTEGTRLLMESFHREAFLQEERSRSKSLQDDLSDCEERCNTLKEKLELATSNLCRFLTGSAGASAAWGSLLVESLLNGDVVLLTQRSPQHVQQWTLLPAWAPASAAIVPSKDVDSMVLELIVIFQSGAWNEVSGAYDTLLKLRKALLGQSGAVISTWMGKFIFMMLAWVVSQPSSCFMVRVASWQIIWLLDERWAAVSDKALLNDTIDHLGEALRLGRPDLSYLDSVQIENGLELFCPSDAAFVKVEGGILQF
ncbi:hypothetical protein FZEAL_8748 [Fusarium zealandicum]|uniref:Uncharacterized protein n=1 Tax=Fusarium zealandicum TaxID=1053134 RepID=A0A8H4UD99_9HYPO|nr:hypothetical protein FZEAL_8748 [Fusarium zealandicum]